MNKMIHELRDKRLNFVFAVMAAVAAVLLSACQSDEQDASDDEKHYSVGMMAYGDFPQNEMEKLHSDIQYCFDTLIPEISVSVVVLQPVSVPESCWNRGHARLRADSLIRFQRRIAKNKETYMLGVTSIDISTSVHGVDDLGILGLSFCPRA